MQFTKLHLKNLGVHRDITLEFRAGINGIVGPNGSGKSQILDGLRFAITGQVVAAGNSSENVSWGEATAQVEAEFRHGDGLYRIERSLGRGRTPPILHMPDKQVRGVQEVERELQLLLGTTVDALLNNVFVPQGAIDSILFSTNTERLREIQETVGLHRCAEAEKALTMELSRYNVTVGLKEQLEMMVNQSAAATLEYQSAEAALAALDKEVELLWPAADQLRRWLADEREWQLIAKADKRIAEVLVTKAQADQRLADARRMVDQLQQSASAMQASADQARADLLAWRTGQKTRQLREQLESQRQGLVSAQASRPALTEDEVQQLEAKAQRVTASLALVRDQLAGRVPRPVMAEEQQLEQQLQTIKAEQHARPARRSIDAVEQQLVFQIKEMKHKLAVFGEGLCPTCKQPVKDHDPGAMQQEILQLEAQLQQMAAREEQVFQEAAQQLQARSTDAQTQLQGLRQAIAEVLNSQIAQLTTSAAHWSADAQEKRALLRTYDQQVDRLKQVNEQLAQLVSNQAETMSGAELESAVQMADELTARLATAESSARLLELNAQSALNAYDQALVDRQALRDVGQIPAEDVVQATRAKVDDLQVKQGEQRRLGEQLAQQRVRSTQLDDTCLRLRKQLETEAKDTAWTTVCRRARDVLHVNGLPTLLMKEYAKILNKKIAYYLDVWEAPFALRLDDDLAFVADFDDGRSHSAARLSGGQKIVASTSFRLAMTDTFARQVELLVLDEPTNYLDKDNIVHLQNLLLKLKELAGQSGRQIILVTHEDQLTGFFDHHISVYH